MDIKWEESNDVSDGQIRLERRKEKEWPGSLSLPARLSTRPKDWFSPFPIVLYTSLVCNSRLWKKCDHIIKRIGWQNKRIALLYTHSRAFILLPFPIHNLFLFPSISPCRSFATARYWISVRLYRSALNYYTCHPPYHTGVYTKGVVVYPILYSTSDIALQTGN